MRQRITTFGTPCPRTWSPAWVSHIEAIESELRRPICGAETPEYTPCTLSSGHPSGRCRYHGGVPNAGPPPGNQNARIHGLYTRRLQRCGPHCPLWDSCAFSGDDVLALPTKQRPVCAYEREEYAALVRHYFNQDLDNPPPSREPDGQDEMDEDDDIEDIDDDEDEDEDEDDDPALARPECTEPFVAHQLILLTIMTTRAAAVLAQRTLTDTIEIGSAKYRLTSRKPDAALEAFIRIAREYRALSATIDAKKLVPEPPSLGIGSRMRPLMKKAAGAVEAAIAETERRKRAEEERRRNEVAKTPGPDAPADAVTPEETPTAETTDIAHHSPRDEAPAPTGPSPHDGIDLKDRGG